LISDAKVSGVNASDSPDAFLALFSPRLCQLRWRKRREEKDFSAGIWLLAAPKVPREAKFPHFLRSRQCVLTVWSLWNAANVGVGDCHFHKKSVLMRFP
jgi:hypothetical protein